MVDYRHKEPTMRTIDAHYILPWTFYNKHWSCCYFATPWRYCDVTIIMLAMRNTHFQNAVHPHFPVISKRISFFIAESSSFEYTWNPLWNCDISLTITMTSLSGNIFRVTGPLWGEFIGDRWFTLTKAIDAELWYFFYLRLNKRLIKQSRRR